MTPNAYAEWHYSKCHLVQYSECRYADRRYAKCRGAFWALPQ